MANQFLIKNTMQDMRNISAVEIDGLKGNNPIYAGVELLGYHQKGDTPAPIIYQYVDPQSNQDPGLDDGGSVIVVGSTKFIHEFKEFVNISYYGHQVGTDFSSALNTILQKFGQVDLNRREVLSKIFKP